jgi:hypothetical protein
MVGYQNTLSAVNRRFAINYSTMKNIGSPLENQPLCCPFYLAPDMPLYSDNSNYVTLV